MGSHLPILFPFHYAAFPIVCSVHIRANLTCLSQGSGSSIDSIKNTVQEHSLCPLSQRKLPCLDRQRSQVGIYFLEQRHQANLTSP